MDSHRLTNQPADSSRRRMGYNVQIGVYESGKLYPYWSDAECIAIDAKTGQRLGASDGRNNGKAVGY